MREIKITADIYCNRNFKPLEFATDAQKSYRVYVDDDLLTERTYIWDNNEVFIQEIVSVGLEPGPHEFRIVPAFPYYDVFNFKNFTINGTVSTDVGLFRSKIFTLNDDNTNSF